MNLCKAILQGCRAQLREDGRVFIGHVGILPRECDEWSDAKYQSKTEKLLNVQIRKDDEEEFKSMIGENVGGIDFSGAKVRD